MRLALIFSASGDRLKLSWNYLERLQALVYQWISAADKKLARSLHEKGYTAGGRRYKLFVYSLLHAESSKGYRDGVELSGQIRWWISSPRNELIEALAVGLLRRSEFSLEQGQLRLEKVSVEPIPEFKTKKVYFRTLSPVVVSTALGQSGQLKKKFLEPKETRFEQVLTENLRRKAMLLGVETTARLEFEPVAMQSRLFCLHGTYVRGWEGWFFLKAEPALLRVGYEAGIGERNGQGFGMVEMVCCRSPMQNPELKIDRIGEKN